MCACGAHSTGSEESIMVMYREHSNETKASRNKRPLTTEACVCPTYSNVNYMYPLL
jgi:ribosomal protein L35